MYVCTIDSYPSSWFNYEKVDFPGGTDIILIKSQLHSNYISVTKFLHSILRDQVPGRVPSLRGISPFAERLRSGRKSSHFASPFALAEGGGEGSYFRPDFPVAFPPKKQAKNHEKLVKLHQRER